MYPFVPFEVFEDNYDINYNRAMLAYNESVNLLIDVLADAIENVTDADAQEGLDTFPANWSAPIEALGDILLQFCCGMTKVQCQNQKCTSFYSNVLQELDTLIDFPTGPQLKTVLLNILEATDLFSPFNVLGAGVDPNFIKEVIRGGVAGNITNRFLGEGIYPEELYYEVVARTLQNDWLFDEYVLVGDGTGGSTTQIFATTV